MLYAGDSTEEEEAAAKRGWPFVKVALNRPLQSLQQAGGAALDRGSPLLDISSEQIVLKALSAERSATA